MATSERGRTDDAPRRAEVAGVARAVQDHFGAAVHPQAVSIFTPFPDRIPLASLKLPAALAEFLGRYEPRVMSDGLYPHQADVLRRHQAGEGPHWILTTATGSGKSLAFWAWVFRHMLEDPTATALLCFPTQALMWGQAERLARISAPKSLCCFEGIAYGGIVQLGKQALPWTVWKGNGSEYAPDVAMQAHGQSPAFAQARIRIATLDKAHYSLLGDVDFTRRLRCLVLDEAHAYDGVFGANVHYFLKRLAAASELGDNRPPGVFLASATLGNAQAFAADLLACPDPRAIVHVPDANRQQIKMLPLAEGLRLLEHPPDQGLLRVVLLVDQAKGNGDLQGFLGNAKLLGNQVNALYFSGSKFQSKTLALDLRPRGRSPGRKVIVYDADLPPPKRRQIEADFNAGSLTGATLLATNALELGVDIDGLDVCLLDELPPARQDLLQRIGRVGRRNQRPGLVVLSASLAPQDRRLIRQPDQGLRPEGVESLPLPVHLDMVRLRHLAAAFKERLDRNYGSGDRVHFKRVMTKHFGECPNEAVLQDRLARDYGQVLDMSGRFWAHSGFRASASQGKVPLREFGDFDANGHPQAALQDGRYHDVAWIEDTSLFRDAHPEGVYLGHDGRRWQVVAYGGRWQEARNAPAGTDMILAKWLRTIQVVYVKPIRERIATRGQWEDHHQPYELFRSLPAGNPPACGKLEFGAWDFHRKWDGYQKINLTTKQKEGVSLAEVAQRFAQAVQQGTNFPYLHQLTYRTFGWRWSFVDSPAPAPLGVQELVQALLERFLAGMLECSRGDLVVELELARGTLALYDAVPGGNGLSLAALAGSRMVEALTEGLTTLKELGRKKQAFQEYAVGLLNIEPGCSVQEVSDVFAQLRDRWQG